MITHGIFKFKLGLVPPVNIKGLPVINDCGSFHFAYNTTPEGEIWMMWELVDGVLYLDDGLNLALTGYNNIRIIDWGDIPLSRNIAKNSERNGVFLRFTGSMPFGNSLPQIEEGSNLSALFFACNIERTQFGNIGKWDVAKVEGMGVLFAYARKFNSDISKWDVGRVGNMEGMFYNADKFNSDISKWDVAKVEDMWWMFFDDSKFINARKFNSDISKWDVAKVGNMYGLFNSADKFNSDISKWDVGRVVSMSSMFTYTNKFNSDISKWDVGRVVNMDSMFYSAVNFNSDISKWDVALVEIMALNLKSTLNFNSDISKWEIKLNKSFIKPGPNYFSQREIDENDIIHNLSSMFLGNVKIQNTYGDLNTSLNFFINQSKSQKAVTKYIRKVPQSNFLTSIIPLIGAIYIIKRRKR